MLAKMLMLTKFIPDIMPFSTCYEFLFHEGHAKHTAGGIQ
jgi:hypothetical protein